MAMKRGKGKTSNTKVCYDCRHHYYYNDRVVRTISYNLCTAKFAV